MTENKRLNIVMDLLHYKTQNEFAAVLEIQAGTLSNLLNETKAHRVSRKIKSILYTRLNVNQQWFETGAGEPFNPGPSAEELAGGVPYYATSHISIAMDEKPEYFVNYKPFNDCSAYVNVYGDNMYPKYAAGEVIAIKEVRNTKIIQWGEAYYIETDEPTNAIRSIRQIHQHTNPNKLILRSSNPNFKGEIIIDRKNLKRLYIIKGKITKNIL